MKVEITVEPSPRGWRFEALDPVAGMAFARRVEQVAPELNSPEIFHFAPPSFHPEPIGRSSIGLGATRGSFQAGLMIEGREATFPSLDAVSEFVRRGYVSGSSGDGGPNLPDGGDTPPREPPSPNELPFERSGGQAEQLAKDMHRYKELVSHCASGEAKQMVWTRPNLGDLGAGKAILNGAAYLLVDLLRSEHRAEMYKHRQAAWLLGVTASRCGIYYRDLFRIADPHQKSSQSPTREGVARGWMHTYDGAGGSSWLSFDQLEVLERWPDPAMPVGSPPMGSLLSWFSKFLSCPIEVLRTMQMQEAIERSAFTAAVLTAQHPLWQLTFSDYKKGRHLEDIGRTAFSWLREHLPRLAFSQSYETAIDNVGAQRLSARRVATPS